MAWIYWTAAAFLTLGIIGTINSGGKPRQPTTGGTAALATIISGGIVALLVIAAINT
mgnify:FL=1